MTTKPHLYEFPRYYELAFCKPESEGLGSFITQVCSTYGKNPIPQAILDIGCGTGKTLEEFAEFASFLGGLDIVPEMVDYAHERLERKGVRHRIWKADMRDFNSELPFDMAICMGGSFQHLYTIDDIKRHLQAAANSLIPGGLYLIDLPSPEKFLETPPGSVESKWRVEKEGVVVDVNFTAQQSPFDWVSQTFTGIGDISVYDHGKDIHLQFPYKYRIFFPQEIEALVRFCGNFELVKLFGDFDASSEYSSIKSPEMIVLLRKRSHTSCI
jgi:SAM-dependent methyltransferase